MHECPHGGIGGVQSRILNCIIWQYFNYLSEMTEEGKLCLNEETQPKLNKMGIHFLTQRVASTRKWNEMAMSYEEKLMPELKIIKIKQIFLIIDIVNK